MPTQATGLPELVRHPVGADMIISTEEEEVVVVVVVVGDGQDNRREVLAVEAGAVKMKADMEAQGISAGRTAAAAAVEDTGEVGMDSNLEPTEAGTTHKVRAVDTASKGRAVGTASKLKVVHMVSNRRATIPTDNKAAMILSLALEDWVWGTTTFLLEIPDCFHCHGNSSRKGTDSFSEGGEQDSHRWYP